MPHAYNAPCQQLECVAQLMMLQAALDEVGSPWQLVRLVSRLLMPLHTFQKSQNTAVQAAPCCFMVTRALIVSSLQSPPLFECYFGANFETQIYNRYYVIATK